MRFDIFFYIKSKTLTGWNFHEDFAKINQQYPKEVRVELTTTLGDEKESPINHGDIIFISGLPYERSQKNYTDGYEQYYIYYNNSTIRITSNINSIKYIKFNHSISKDGAYLSIQMLCLLSIIKLKMAKKKIQKIKKEIHLQDSTEKDNPMENKQNILLNSFSLNFRQKIDQFVNINKDIISLKNNVENSMLESNYSQRYQRVAQQIEKASLVILEAQLVKIQKWIKQEKLKLEDDIKKIQKAYQQNRQFLIQTKLFSEDQINIQTSLIKNKVQQKQEIIKHYGILLERSKRIYSLSQ